MAIHRLRRQPWLPLVLSFEWPSVAYALDILAWDVFAGLLAVLFYRSSPVAPVARQNGRTS